MNYLTTYIVKFRPSFLKSILTFGLLLFAFGNSLVFAQKDTIPPSELIMRDTIDVSDSARTGLINKLVQPFRFRENRNRKERERVVDLIRSLTTSGDLAIDSVTVQLIADELLELTNQLSVTRDTTFKIQNEIAKTIRNLDSKAPQTLVDSIQVQLGNVLQGLLDESQKEKAAEKIKLNAALVELRKVGLSCGAPGLLVLQDTLADTLIVNYQFCLKAKKPVFGWYGSTNNFQEYNLNYLTDLVLDSYQVGSDGLEANPKGLKAVLDSAVLSKGLAFGKRISLSVETSSSQRTRELISNAGMATRFFTRINELIIANGLNGLNLNLTGLRSSDSKAVSAFVSKLKASLSEVDNSLILTLNVPPLANSSQIQIASSLDYANLNPWIDYYLIQTQRLNIEKTTIPFSLSPLFPDQVSLRGSIENAVNFYANGKVPVNKLVVTLSYEGIFWEMRDFVPGSRAKDFGTIVDYLESQAILTRALESETGAVVGFDPIQSSSYLNYKDGVGLKQLWFTDPMGLATKYQWLLDNNLGGVAILGLGTEGGSTSLWDVLGASMIELDSLVLSSQKIQIEKPIDQPSFLDYLKSYSRDIQWAGLNDIYIGDPNKKPKEEYCYYEIYPDSDSLKVLADQKGIQSYWDYESKFSKYPGTDYYSLDSDLECICLLGRWDRYAEINLVAFISFFIALIISVAIMFIGLRRNGEEWSFRSLLIALTITFGLLSFISLFFYLFFDTHFQYIGAGSNEVTIWGVMIIFLIGILAGIIIHRLRISKTFTQKDLP
ncbi:glycoside hydrolase family 18 protein [Algoriphagus marincola]|uniref:glycoside hydrolase family 18 protein n=1 Tax=Algoriphagus marincola TaxID=264027 RepID=UPI0005594A4D|nr:glycoside hydrolase family 18 protein [Algoriphagus marincola]